MGLTMEATLNKFPHKGTSNKPPECAMEQDLSRNVALKEEIQKTRLFIFSGPTQSKSSKKSESLLWKFEYFFIYMLCIS
jgi:hypothetical protein